MTVIRMFEADLEKKKEKKKKKKHGEQGRQTLQRRDSGSQRSMGSYDLTYSGL